jgi:hypothetical protein
METPETQDPFTLSASMLTFAAAKQEKFDPARAFGSATGLPFRCLQERKVAMPSRSADTNIRLCFIGDSKNLVG